MGLNERRKIKEYQDTIVPERQAELSEICGCPIAYEIEWDTFAEDLEALNFLDNLSFHRINMAFRVICTDELGREAVAESLKRIRLKNVPTRDEMSMTFTDGLLEMHCAYRLRLDGVPSDNEIRAYLIDRL